MWISRLTLVKNVKKRANREGARQRLQCTFHAAHAPCQPEGRFCMKRTAPRVGAAPASDGVEDLP